MELKALTDYFAADFNLMEGETTVGLKLSEERKAALLEAWPDRFEVCEGTAPVEELVIETPEDGLGIETPEDKLPKSRKK
jgi:hypothetical protein